MKKTIAAMLLLWLPQTGAADSAVNHIEVVTEQWPPYNYALPDGKVGGLSTDIVRQTLTEAGLSHTINIYPWARSFETARNQPNVLIYSIFRSREREHLFKWICPLTEPVKLYVYRLKDRKALKVDTIQDARRYTTGVTRGDYPHHYLLSVDFKEDKHLQLAPSDKANVKKLLNRRVDLVIEAELTMRTVLKELNQSYDKVEIISQIKSDEEAPNCMAFGRQTSDALVKRVSDALHKVHQKRKRSAP